MDVNAIKQMIDQASAGGKIFSVKFVKGNGTIREMNCRRNVKKHLVGGPTKYPAKQGAIGVYDIQAKGYRCFYPQKVLAIKGGGINFERKSIDV